MEKHFRILGYLFIIWGAVELIAILVVSAAPGLFRVGPPPAIVLVLVLITAALFILAGWALLARKDWARPIAIAASIVAVFNVPLGTALGIYGLWAMFSSKGREQFPTYAHPVPG